MPEGMAKAGAFVLITAMVFLIQRFAPGEGVGLVLALGFSLVAAGLLGEAADRVRLPRLSGYLLFGLLCGPYLLNLITTSMARDLQVINAFAIALIAFVAGLELNLARLRPQLRAMLVVGGLTIAGLIAILTLLLWLAWPWLPLPDPGSTMSRLAAALVTAALVVSFSPTVSIAVIADSRARGPLSELTIAIVVLGDMALILVFALAMQLARWAEGAAAGDVSVLGLLAWEVLGSLAFGAIAGALFAFYLQRVHRALTLALLGLCALLATLSPALDFELVLSGLAAGLVVENIAPPAGDRLKVAVERGALPVLIVFFAAAGASLQLDALAVLGWTALVLAAIRLGLIRAITARAVRAAGLPAFPARLVWMGLVSQAGVTLGLATIVAVEFPEWGAAVQTLVVALTGLHLLAGPILFRAALVRAGEVGQLDADAALSAAPAGPAT